MSQTSVGPSCSRSQTPLVANASKVLPRSAATALSKSPFMRRSHRSTYWRSCPAVGSKVAGHYDHSTVNKYDKWMNLKKVFFMERSCLTCDPWASEQWSTRKRWANEALLKTWAKMTAHEIRSNAIASLSAATPASSRIWVEKNYDIYLRKGCATELLRHTYHKSYSCNSNIPQCSDLGLRNESCIGLCNRAPPSHPPQELLLQW